ncbi:MAG TPA: SPFH domain-containing protein [Candidatus Babeliales bacterium]|jgi:regulator of protease activity HflC (stomatin/prohibitin superfamily)|nr:SPFH domain-containing protein [Candidatus Babeliales bacterium]
MLSINKQQAATILFLSSLLFSTNNHAMIVQKTNKAVKKIDLKKIAARNISWGCFYIVPQQKSIILERFGKFKKILQPGIRFKWPLIEEARKIEWSYIASDDKRYFNMISHIDLRETPHNIPSQKVITQDNVAMTINGILYVSISNPEKVAYAVNDINAAIEQLAQTTLRDVIGSITLDDTSKSRDAINKKLKVKLQESADRWGVVVNHIELKEILPPYDIQHAMESQMKAERERRAAILTAEGQKTAAILLAEGKKEAVIKEAEAKNQATILDAEARAKKTILEADAEAKARFALADAEARGMKIVQEAAPEHNALAYLIATKYISALPAITEGKAGKTVVVPYDANALAGVTSIIQNFITDAKRE